MNVIKVMSTYKMGKIYKIIGNDLTYIGSTTESLNKRLQRHRQYVKDNRYCSSSKVLDNGNEKIELIELYPCENKKELIEREQYWCDIIKNCNDRNAKQPPKNYKHIYHNWKLNNPDAYKKQLERSRLWKHKQKKASTNVLNDYLQKI